MTGGFDAVLIAAAPRRAAAEEAIALAGGRLLEALDWSEAGELMGRSLGRPVLVLEAEGAADDVLLAALPQVRGAADALNLGVVATLGRGQIDLIGGVLIGVDAQLLCEAGLAERVAAIALAGRRTRDEAWLREGEGERLARLNAEVARIAALLARLVDRDALPEDDGVGDRHVGFGFAPPDTPIDPQTVRHAIRARRMRDAFFGEGLFEDPAWDMLLDLYAAHLEGGRVSVSSLCIAAAVAPTTALRWIGKLTAGGLLERHPDPVDRRRAFLALSPRTLGGMQGYFAAVRGAGLPIA